MKALNICIIHINVDFYVEGLHDAVKRLIFHNVVTVGNVVVVGDGVLLLRHLFS